jgi:hypothetical protein
MASSSGTRLLIQCTKWATRIKFLPSMIYITKMHSNDNYRDQCITPQIGQHFKRVFKIDCEKRKIEKKREKSIPRGRSSCCRVRHAPILPAGMCFTCPLIRLIRGEMLTTTKKCYKANKRTEPTNARRVSSRKVTVSSSSPHRPQLKTHASSHFRTYADGNIIWKKKP